MLNRIIVCACTASLLTNAIIPLNEDVNEIKDDCVYESVDEEDIYRIEGEEMQCIVSAPNDDIIDDVLENVAYQKIDGAEQCAVAVLSEEEIDQLAEMEGVDVEVDIKVKAMDDEEDAIATIVNDAWNLAMVDADMYSDDETDSVKIAVIDSGSDYGEDIAITSSIDFTSAEERGGYDFTGHGTAIEGIIGATDNSMGTTGIVQSTELYSLKVLDDSNSAPVSRIVEAISWCMDHDIDIINMSFGTEYNSQALENIVNQAAGSGILMVASAGNRTSDMEKVAYPAAYDAVIAVGAVDSQGRNSAVSILGEEVELMAPGENVPLNSFYDGVTIGTGTSYAAAHVTAVAARLWAMDRSKDPEFIRQLMQKTAISNGEEGSGYGIVNLKNAKEAYSEFESMYVSSAISDFSVSDNSVSGNSIHTYEMPAYVQANWKKEGHMHLVTAGSTTASLTSDELALLKEASKWSDYNLNDDKKINGNSKLFHAAGYTNYVAVTRYLYNVAVRIKNGVSIETACNASVYAPTDDAAAANSKQTLKEAVISICNANLTGQSAVTDTAKRNGLKVLGLALHAAEDAYAHKSMVTMDAWNDIVTKSSGIYTNNQLNEIADRINRTSLTFAAVATYNNAFTKELHGVLTDDASVSPQRYSRGAKWAATKLITGFDASNNNDRHYFTAEVFYPNMNNSSYYSYRTHQLVKHVKAVYNNSLPTLGNGITASDWMALSACD